MTVNAVNPGVFGAAMLSGYGGLTYGAVYSAVEGLGEWAGTLTGLKTLQQAAATPVFAAVSEFTPLTCEFTPRPVNSPP